EPGLYHERQLHLRVRRRLDLDFHEETIARRSGNLERFLPFHPIPVGKNLEVRETVLPIERGNAALRHYAEQQGMHLWTGAVHLVEKEGRKRFAVLQQWSRGNFRLAELVHVGVVDQVCGHQVDRTLDPRVAAADDAGDASEQGRFADADVALQ